MMPIFTFVPERSRTPARLLVGGGYDSVVRTGTLQWHPSTDETYWVIDAFVGVDRHVPTSLLVDTGTSLILMPPDHMLGVLRSLAGKFGEHCVIKKQSSMCFCACEDVPHMNSLKLYLGSPQQKPFVLQATELFERTEGMHLKTGQEACRLLISTSPQIQQASMWTLGDVFLRRVVTVFNFEGRSVGFGELLESEPEDTNISAQAVPRSSQILPGAPPNQLYQELHGAAARSASAAPLSQRIAMTAALMCTVVGFLALAAHRYVARVAAADQKPPECAELLE
jgi:hypothetical protein